MKPECYAAIDIGSNTVKTLVMAEADPGQPLRHLADWCETTGLGAGLQNRLLAPDSMNRTLAAITRQVAEAQRLCPAVRIAGVATSASREAENGVDFVRRCEAACGLPAGTIRVLSGEEEAMLTYQGASSAIESGPFVNADPGGGSMEFSYGMPGEKPKRFCSVKMGCGRWRDRYGLADVASAEALASARQEAERLAGEVASSWNVNLSCRFSVTGGTAHAVASLLAGREYIMFEPMPVVSRSALEDLLRRLASMPCEVRQGLPGMPAGRASVMPAGIILILAAMEKFGFQEFLPNPYGLRYALLNSLRQ